jgi:hypothetical protein
MSILRISRPAGITIHKNHFELPVEAVKELYSECGMALRREYLKLGGRPRSGMERCPCGQMTALRAKARAHKCTPEGPILAANRRGLWPRG